MDEQHLANSNFIYLQPFGWRLRPVDPDSSIPFPLANIPPLTAHAESYLFEGQVPIYVPEVPLEPPGRVRPHTRRDIPSTSGAGPSEEQPGNFQGYSPFEEQILASMGRLETGMGNLQAEFGYMRQEFRGLDSRVTRLENNFERASQPWYNFAYRHHMVPQDLPTPSWYRPVPADDDCYEISLAHGLDRLQLGDHTFRNVYVPEVNQGDGAVAMDQDQGGEDYVDDDISGYLENPPSGT